MASVTPIRPRLSLAPFCHQAVRRLAARVIRHDYAECYAAHVLVDSAAAGYCWDCLTDAMTEFGGGLVGMQVLDGLTVVPKAEPDA